MSGVRSGGDKETVKIDEVSSSVTYIGYALAGTPTSVPQWKIRKISVVSTVTTIGYASGDDSYDFIWDNRASYSYS